MATAPAGQGNELWHLQSSASTACCSACLVAATWCSSTARRSSSHRTRAPASAVSTAARRAASPSSVRRSASSRARCAAPCAWRCSSCNLAVSSSRSVPAAKHPTHAISTRTDAVASGALYAPRQKVPSACMSIVHCIRAACAGPACGAAAPRVVSSARAWCDSEVAASCCARNARSSSRSEKACQSPCSC